MFQYRHRLIYTVVLFSCNKVLKNYHAANESDHPQTAKIITNVDIELAGLSCYVEVLMSLTQLAVKSVTNYDINTWMFVSKLYVSL